MWLRIEGLLERESAARLARQIRRALHRTRDRLVLDLARLKEFEAELAHSLAETLAEYRDRIRILGPEAWIRSGVPAAVSAFDVGPMPRE